MKNSKICQLASVLVLFPLSILERAYKLFRKQKKIFDEQSWQTICEINNILVKIRGIYPATNYNQIDSAS